MHNNSSASYNLLGGFQGNFPEQSSKEGTTILRNWWFFSIEMKQWWKVYIASKLICL